MNGLDPRRINKYFAPRTRKRQIFDHARIEFDRQIRLGIPIRTILEEVGAQGRLNQIKEGAQNAVFVRVHHIFKLGDDIAFDGFGLGHQPRIAIRVKAGNKQADKGRCQCRIIGKGLGHIILREGRSHLTHVARIGAQDHDFAPMQPAEQDKTVKGVIFHFTVPHANKQFLELVTHVMQVEFTIHNHAEIMDTHIDVNVAWLHRERVLGDDLKTHVFKHRQHIGQRHGHARIIDFKPKLVLGSLNRAIQVHPDIKGLHHVFDTLNVECGTFNRETIAIVA